VNQSDIRAQIAALQSQLEDVGVYADPATGLWYLKFRDRHGRQVTRRRSLTGDALPTREAALDARREWMEADTAGRVTVGRVRFAAYWEQYLRHRRGEMTRGSWADLRTHGRRRLVPWFGDMLVPRVDVATIRDWRTDMVELVENGDISAKTVNNARVALLGCLGMAAAEGLLPANPVVSVKPLAVEVRERQFLRVEQIPVYLDAAPAYYRDLAGLLIAGGLRVSEAIVIQPGDVDVTAGTVRVMRQRDPAGPQLRTMPTKGKRFRTVTVGRRAATRLGELVAVRAEHGREWLYETPRLGAPPRRQRVHTWHKATLADAGLPAMPLHALRHTAAAAWLASGHSLEFVRAQLGHATIQITSDHYAHLEQQFRGIAAQVTEDLIFGHD
jgi:integrase